MIVLLARWVQSNLIVFIALFVLPVKFVVVRVCKDVDAELAVFLSLPEDICYVSFGLVAGDVVNGVGAFGKYFGQSSLLTIEKCLTVSLGLTVAAVVHVAAKKTGDHIAGWRASQIALKNIESYEQVPNPVVNFTTLMTRHFALFLIGYLTQLALVLPWLVWIAKVVRIA